MAVVYVKRVAASRLQFQFASGDCMTDFDRQLYPVKLSSPLSLREQEFNHLLRNWPVEPDASRGACPVRRRLCRVIRFP